MSRILVSGGAGFIGSNIVDVLLAKNHTIVVVDDLSTGDLDNLPKFPNFSKTNFIHKSITEDLSYIFDKYRFDYVFHLAAQIDLRKSIKEPKFDAETNIIGSLNIIENCIKFGVKKLIFSSSGGAVYNPNSKLPWDEDSEVAPKSPYGLSKLTIEKYLNIIDLPYVALRYGNVFGRRQSSKNNAGIISIFIDKALKNDDFIIYGTGEQCRDFIYIDSVVEANVLALEKNLCGIYNVSSGIQISVNDIAKIIIDITKSKSKIIYKPAIQQELLYSQLSSQKLINEGWNKPLSLEEGIKKTVDYFIEKA